MLLFVIYISFQTETFSFEDTFPSGDRGHLIVSVFIGSTGSLQRDAPFHSAAFN